MGAYMQSLQFLIDKLSHSRKLHISILDLSGILDTPNTKIDIKNVVHSCKYCAIAKSTPKGGKACLRCKMLANTKAINCKTPFGGYCFYGLYEIAYPVLSDGTVVAIVYVGNTVIDKNKSIERINKMCKRTKVNPLRLIAELENCEQLNSPDELFGIGELVADYLKWLYDYSPKYKHEIHWLVYLMKRHADELHQADVSLSELAKTYQKNEKYLGRLFKKEMGVSYNEYRQEKKLEKAKRLLKKSDDKIINIALECGFNNISYFNRSFQKKYGCTPSEYRLKSKTE